MNAKSTLAVALAAGLFVGCGIPKDEHNAVLAELENCKMELADTQKAKAESEEALNAEIAKLSNQIADLEKSKSDLEAALDKATGTLSMYESKTGGLEAALKATKDELEELRKQRQQAEKRLAEYRKLAKRLASMIQSGKLSVKVRNGKMVIELPNNILFESGKTQIKEDGMAALTELAGVLATIGKRQFLVAGHTDNVPTKTSGFKSNWALSTARAVNVVQFLQDAGVAPNNLAAAGYGEFDPVAANDTDEGKALNRRIEIILMPNLDELPALPDDLFKS